MKKIILLGLAALLTYSCSSDDDNPVDNTDASLQDVILPIKMVEDGEVLKINYDGTKILNLVSETDPNNKIVFTYSGEYISGIKLYRNNILRSTYDYTYSNGLLSNYISKDYDDNGSVLSTLSYIYTHTNSSQINVKKQATDFNNYTMNSTYTYSNGNITSISGTGTGTDNGITRNYTFNGNYTYSDKNYPFKNVKGFDKLIFNGDDENGLSFTFSNIKNNLNTSKDVTNFTDSNGASSSYYSAYKYETTYNSNGYPISRIEKSTDLNGNPDNDQPTIYTFEYNH